MSPVTQAVLTFVAALTPGHQHMQTDPFWNLPTSNKA